MLPLYSPFSSPHRPLAPNGENVSRGDKTVSPRGEPRGGGFGKGETILGHLRKREYAITHAEKEVFRKRILLTRHRPHLKEFCSSWQFLSQEECAAHLKKVLEKGDIDLRDEEGRTLLMRRVMAGPAEAPSVKLLLESGADPNIPNHRGQTPLDWAVWNKEDGLKQVLEEAGARRSSVDKRT